MAVISWRLVDIIFMDIGEYFVNGYWWLLMSINDYFIGEY
jgi:hypothetical protein